ncbi:MAG: hypothetical protein FWD11_00970 [Micrococcales bacterium]|nr:hypothetical protein [Micrococcales bacterium]
MVLVGGDDALAARLVDHQCTVDRVAFDQTPRAGSRAADVVVVASGPLGSADPENSLIRARDWLTPDGKLVLFFGNAVHADRRLAVLAGKRLDDVPSPDGATGFDLDTRDHALAVVAAAGLRATGVYATVRDPSEPSDEVPAVLASWVQHQPETSEATFVVVAQDGDAASPAPATVLAADHPGANAHLEPMPELDGMEAASAESARLRRALLNARDYQIGTMAESRVLRRERDRLRKDLKMVTDSPDFRIGRLLVNPARKMKYLLKGDRG